MRVLRTLLVMVFLIAATACEGSDPTVGSDLPDKTPSEVEASPATADASAYAKLANESIEDFLPKGWEKVYSDVSMYGAGSLITYVYTYVDDYPLWRTVVTADQRKVMQRYCDGVLEPEMNDFGLDNPRVSYLYVHPKAPKVDSSSTPKADDDFMFVVPKKWGPNPSPRVADRFMCE